MTDAECRDMTRWECPYCHVLVWVHKAANAVGHRCPNIRNKWVDWRKS